MFVWTRQGINARKEAERWVMNYRRYILAASFGCCFSAQMSAAETPPYESDESIRQRLGVSHHGGAITDCSPPMFFEEVPAKDAKVAAFQDFSLVASDNTESDTVRVWVNNQAAPVTISAQRSGRLTIQGRLGEPILSGRVWIKVTGYSHDGCDQLHAWYVYVGG